MEIWLKQGTEKLQLPVLPSGIEQTVSQLNTSVTISNYGEVNIIGRRGLKSLSLSSFFPCKKYYFSKGDLEEPYKICEMLLSWMGEPVDLVVTDADVKMKVTIESFKYGESDGTGDVYYTLDLKEYRIPEVKVEKPKAVNKNDTKITKPTGKRESKTTKDTVYTVKAGDTLSKIAKRLTGDSSNYMAIANQNGIKNPNMIHVGQKLVIKV